MYSKTRHQEPRTICGKVPIAAPFLDQLVNLIMHSLRSVLRTRVGGTDGAAAAVDSLASDERGQGENSGGDNSLHLFEENWG